MIVGRTASVATTLIGAIRGDGPAVSVAAMVNVVVTVSRRPD